MSDRHGSFYALVIGDVPPVVAVVYDRENGPQGRDSGFMVVFSDAPPPGQLGDEPVSGVVDLGCLLDDFPDLAPTLDLAREHGEVWLVDGGWVPLDEVDDDERGGGA